MSVEEFTERCLQLHGPARSADLFALRQQTASWSRVRCARLVTGLGLMCNRSSWNRFELGEPRSVSK